MIVEFWKAYRRQSRSPGSLVTRLRGHLARGKYVVGTPPTSLSLRKQMLKEALSVDADKATAEALGSTFEELPPGNLSAPGNVEVGSASSASEARIGNQTTSGHLPTSSIGLPIDMMERGIDQSRDARSISDRDLARGESKHKGMDGEGGRRQDVDSGVLHPASTIGRVLTAFGNSQRLWNEWHLDSDPSDDSDDGVGHEGLDSEGGAQFDKDEKEKEEQEEEEDMDPRDVTAMDLQQWWVVRRGAEEGEEATPNRDDADGDDGEDEDEDEEEVEEQGGGGPFSLNGGGHSGARFGEFLGLEHGWEDFEESLALPLNHYRDHDLPDENDNDAEDHYIGSENDPREQGMGESEDDGALVDTFEPTYRASLISDEGEDEVDDVSKADENSRFTLSPDQTVTRTDNLNEEQEQGSF